MRGIFILFWWVLKCYIYLRVWSKHLGKRLVLMEVVHVEVCTDTLKHAGQDCTKQYDERFFLKIQGLIFVLHIWILQEKYGLQIIIFHYFVASCTELNSLQLYLRLHRYSNCCAPLFDLT